MTAPDAQAAPSSRRFLDAIALTPTAPERGDHAFFAHTQYVPWPKAYGGDMVAQSAAAAIATVGDDRTLHSLHSSFLRPVDVESEVRYEVEVVRDGRGYSTRQVRAYQHGKLAFLCTASFQVPEDGPEHTLVMPDVPAPEDLPSSAEVLRDATGNAAEYWAHGRSFDQRHIPGPLFVNGGDEKAPHVGLWVRAFDALPDDAHTHQLAIAYVCDYSILEPSLRALGLNWSSPGLMTASLDHSMWFHRPARADEWLLYAQETAGVQSGRGLNIGRFFTRSGDLVATVAQEGLLRSR